MSSAADTTKPVNFVISEDRENELWKLLLQYRSNSRVFFLPSIRWLRSQGEKLEISDILYLQQRLKLNQDYLSLPFSVVRFYSQLVNSRRGSFVLDPAGGTGLLGAWISLNEYIQKIDVITSYADSEELINPLNLPSLALHIGSISNVRYKLAAKYDAIVSIPPIGLGLQHRTFQTIDGNKIELNDDPSSLLIAEVADLLAQDGILAFVVSPKFEWYKKPNSIRCNLEKFGLHLSTLLKFPPGTFYGTNLALDLAIIERVNYGNLFVAEIPEDAKEQDELITRLWKRKKGFTPSQGWIITEDQFHGLQALKAAERAKELARNKGLVPTPFNEAVIKINSPKDRGTGNERYEEHLNAVYLPQMATTKARVRQDNLPDGLKSYFQLIVDSAVVQPEYLAEMLNTPIGYAIRESSMQGAAIPRIDESILTKSTLYLPPLVEQNRAMEALSLIQKLRSELAEFESQIWEKPRQVSKVIEGINKVNHDERCKEWLESLPFPLATILRLYYAVNQKEDEKEKYEILLNFFEAFAEFCATIHLSAFRKNQVHWENKKGKLDAVMKENNFVINRPTFGLWAMIVGFFAGELRLMLNGNPKDKDLAKEIYETSDLRLLEILSSKKLVSLIQEANNYRNRAVHSSFVPPEEVSIKRHAALKRNLATFRKIVGTVFLQYQLIKPKKRGVTVLEGPVFNCMVQKVMGSDPQLEDIVLELTTPATSGTLCLHNPGHDKVLELLPLIRVTDTIQPVSYFYKKIENMKMNFVSYYLTDPHEITEDLNDSVKKLLTDLNSEENY